MNQIFLLVSLTFSKREPDVEHPFGYGKERFFWSFMAAVTIFVAGAVFSAFQGIERILSTGSEKESFGIAYAILGFSLVAEGISLARAVRQTRAEAREKGRPTSSTSAAAATRRRRPCSFEDRAAVVGVLLALAGVAASQMTGATRRGTASHRWRSPCCSPGVAIGLGHQTTSCSIGRAAAARGARGDRGVIRRHPGVDEVGSLFTMVLAPDQLLVAAHVDVDDGCSGDDVERMTAEIEEELRREVPVGLAGLPRPDPARARGRARTLARRA